MLTATVLVPLKRSRIAEYGFAPFNTTFSAFSFMQIRGYATGEAHEASTRRLRLLFFDLQYSVDLRLGVNRAGGGGDGSIVLPHPKAKRP
jgi:hypothetical protein